MSGIEEWFTEQPRRRPAEIACLFARDPFWRDEQRRMIGTHAEWPDVVDLLELNDELAHAFVLVLSRLPEARRRAFADAFYAERPGRMTQLPGDAVARTALAAEAVLQVVDLAGCDERTLDLLRGAAQGDDLTRAPAQAVDELRTTIARMRVDADDPSDAHDAASLAVAEVLDPSSGIVDLKEVLARCAWAVVEARQAREVLDFLLGVDQRLSEAGYDLPYQPHDFE